MQIVLWGVGGVLAGVLFGSLFGSLPSVWHWAGLAVLGGAVAVAAAVRRYRA